MIESVKLAFVFAPDALVLKLVYLFEDSGLVEGVDVEASVYLPAVR